MSQQFPRNERYVTLHEPGKPRTDNSIRIPWWIWLILAIILVIAIIFLILWLTKSAPKPAPNPTGFGAGLFQSCVVTLDCATGLTCTSGKCVCQAPSPPTDLIATSPAAGKLEAKFTSEITPITYDIIMYEQSNLFDPVLSILNLGFSTKEVQSVARTGIPAGTYKVYVIPRSPICSSGSPTPISASVNNVIVA